MPNNNSLTTAINLEALGNLQTFTGDVGTSDRNDLYRFELTQNGQVVLNLSGLTEPGQVSIIADLNNNGVWDNGEEVTSDTISDFSTSVEARSITRALPKGVY